MSWSVFDGSSPGYDASHFYGKYTISVSAQLQGVSSIYVPAFTFILDVDCCASPTILTAPTIAQALYTYDVNTVGTTLNIPLTGSYTGDNACCSSLAVAAPSITPADTHSSIFTFSNANLQTDVHSSDIDNTGAGPGGNQYTITYSPPAGCYTPLADVTFDVMITNTCGTATFSIDTPNSVFKTPSTPSLTYTVAETEAVLSWNSSSDYSSSNAPTDNCGVIVEKIMDVTSGTQ